MRADSCMQLPQWTPPSSRATLSLSCRRAGAHPIQVAAPAGANCGSLCAYINAALWYDNGAEAECVRSCRALDLDSSNSVGDRCQSADDQDACVKELAMRFAPGALAPGENRP